MASNKIQDFRSGLVVKCNPDGTVTLGSKNWRFLTTAITANSTTTSLAAGTFGSTSHATGRDKIFVSDGTKWQNLSPGSSIADAVADAGALTSATLTDNTGGTANTTLTALGGLTTLTDNSGGSGTHDDTIADGLTTTAFDADNGGATADGTVEAMTGLPVVVDLTNMEDGSANNVLEAVTDTSGSDQSGPIERNFDKIGDEVNTTVAFVTALANNVQECVDKIQTITTDLGVQNQNDSDLAQKLIEVVADIEDAKNNFADVAAQINALRVDVGEVRTQLNALLASQRAAGQLTT